MNQFSSNLQKWLTGLCLAEMKAQKLSIAELSRRCYMSDKQIGRMFSGKSAGSIGAWDDILRQLGIRLWPDVSPQDAKPADMLSERSRLKIAVLEGRRTTDGHTRAESIG